MWPEDVSLCELIIDDGLSSTGLNVPTFVTVKLLVEGTTRLVWSDGTEFLPLPDRLRNPEVIKVPATDQPWRDGGGNTYSGFAYEITVERERLNDTAAYTTRVQPTTATPRIVISETVDGSIGEPIIVPPENGGGSTGAQYPRTGSTWIVNHSLGRIPVVQIVVDGEQVWTKVLPTTTSVTAIFPNPTTGVIVLT